METWNGINELLFLNIEFNQFLEKQLLFQLFRQTSNRPTGKKNFLGLIQVKLLMYTFLSFIFRLLRNYFIKPPAFTIWTKQKYFKNHMIFVVNHFCIGFQTIFPLFGKNFNISELSLL
jgi:hypothetical protein